MTDASLMSLSRQRTQKASVRSSRPTSCHPTIVATTVYIPGSHKRLCRKGAGGRVRGHLGFSWWSHDVRPQALSSKRARHRATRGVYQERSDRHRTGMATRARRSVARGSCGLGRQLVVEDLTMKIESRRIVAGGIPATEFWTADRYARVWHTEHGYTIEMLLYPGKKEAFALTESEARKIVRQFLLAK